MLGAFAGGFCWGLLRNSERHRDWFLGSWVVIHMMEHPPVCRVVNVAPYFFVEKMVINWKNFKGFITISINNCTILICNTSIFSYCQSYKKLKKYCATFTTRHTGGCSIIWMTTSLAQGHITLEKKYIDLSDYHNLTSDRLYPGYRTCSTRPRLRHQGPKLLHSACIQNSFRVQSRWIWPSSYPTSPSWI